MFKPFLQEKANLERFFSPPVLNFVSQKIWSPDRTCGGTWIRIKKEPPNEIWTWSLYHPLSTGIITQSKHKFKERKLSVRALYPKNYVLSFGVRCKIRKNHLCQFSSRLSPYELITCCKVRVVWWGMWNKTTRKTHSLTKIYISARSQPIQIQMHWERRRREERKFEPIETIICKNAQIGNVESIILKFFKERTFIILKSWINHQNSLFGDTFLEHIFFMRNHYRISITLDAKRYEIYSLQTLWKSICRILTP